MPIQYSGERYFTKHLFRTGCECVTRLYYKSRDEYPENRTELPFIAHIRFNKRQLIRLFKLLHPNGIDIDTSETEKALGLTEKFLKKKRATIFNGIFLTEGLLVKVPVVKKENDRLHIYQIQTKAFDPRHHSLTGRNGKIRSSWMDYLRDYAFQLFVIKKIYPDYTIIPYLVLPDRSGTAPVSSLDLYLADISKEAPPEEIENLVKVLPVTTLIDRIWSGEEEIVSPDHPLQGSSFSEMVESLSQWYFEEKKNDPTVGKKCRNCEFRVPSDELDNGSSSGFKECWKPLLQNDMDKPHIFDLFGPGNTALLEQEIYLQSNVALDDDFDSKSMGTTNGKISDFERRKLQIAKAKGLQMPREIVKPNLFEELEKWEYPLHFLDFEAGSYAIPLRKDRRPYQLVVFQFSCHTLYENGSLQHTEWLHSGSNSYPSYEMVKALHDVPDIEEGTIVQYSGFEREALKKIYKELDRADGAEGETEMMRWLNTVFRRADSSGSEPPFLADMSRMVKSYYFNVAMRNSLSIKDVLRSVMELSPVLQERFTKPYSSSNFDSVTWCQKHNGNLRNPYDILQSQQEISVGRGTEAMVAYSKLRTEKLSSGKEERIRRALLRYCELDTLAMVMIYLHWNELFERRDLR